MLSNMFQKTTVRNVHGKKVAAEWHVNPNETMVIVPKTLQIGENVYIGGNIRFPDNYKLPSNCIIGSYDEVVFRCVNQDEVDHIEVAHNANGERPRMKNGDVTCILTKLSVLYR
jgi:hypothetical protein